MEASPRLLVLLQEYVVDGEVAVFHTADVDCDEEVEYTKQHVK